MRPHSAPATERRRGAPKDRSGAAEAEEEETGAEDPTPVVVSADLPESLNRRALEQGIEAVRERVLTCRTEEGGATVPFAGIVEVYMSIGTNGAVQSAAALPPVEGTPLGSCVAKAVRAAAFPRFRGALVPVVEWTYPFLFPAAEEPR
jgi:hypothetical protein